MESYKQEFIEFMVDCEVLKFGSFVTKSGRNTPFFVNTGFYLNFLLLLYLSTTLSLLLHNLFLHLIIHDFFLFHGFFQDSLYSNIL